MQRLLWEQQPMNKRPANQVVIIEVKFLIDFM